MSTQDPRILVAEMLITLGISTYQQIHSYFAKDVDDDVLLDSLLSQLDARIARRNAPPTL